MSFDERGGVPVRRPSTEGRRSASPSSGPSDDTGAARRFRRPRPGLRTVVLGAILPVVLLTVWWTLSASGAVPSYLLPSPPQVVQAAVELGEAGLLSTYVLISIQRVLIGFAIGASIGLALGALVGLSRTASELLSPLLGALRAVPSLAWLPLLILLLGIFETPKITLIAIGAVFPVFTVVSGALRHVDPHLVEVGRAFGLSRLSLLAAVQLPAVVPAVVSGLRLALVQSWLFLVAAELAGSSMGLGFLLSDSQNNGRMDRLFLAIILLGTLGKLTDALVGLGERALLKRWG
ncbi:ABC transporter permease [Microcella sp.]|uniref:ABC transporter permease n=1 Tax=Microcella sp. TaxID=1913979 RepID=UPI00391CAB20